MAVYQDAYRKADTLLRQKTEKEILKTQVANTTQDGRKVCQLLNYQGLDLKDMFYEQIVPPKHEDQITDLERKLNLAIGELTGLKTELNDTKRAHHVTQQALDDAHSALSGHKAAQSQVEHAHNALCNRFNALLAAYNGIAADKASLEHDLSKAQTKIEDDKATVGEALSTLYVEQEKNKDLGKKLANSDALLTAANDRAASLESELDDLKADLADTTDSENSFSFSVSTYELELERDMYQSQEQEALEALEAEKTIRLSLEKDLEASRANEQQAIATSEAHERARVKADKEKLEISTQLQAALATVTELTTAILKEEEEEQEDNTTCEELQTPQIGRVAAQKKSDSVQHPFQPTNFDAQTSYLGLPAYDYFANTPIKPARTNKENLGVVFRVRDHSVYEYATEYSRLMLRHLARSTLVVSSSVTLSRSPTFPQHQHTKA